LTSSALCSVASPTVDPDTFTGSITAERRDASGAPDVDRDVLEPRGDLLRRVLEGDRPPRRFGSRAELALQQQAVDLDHDAVDLVLDVVAVLSPPGDVAAHVGEVVEHLVPWRHGQASAASRS
jgi:hypothetical protein